MALNDIEKDLKENIEFLFELENRNNVSPLNMYENDMFGSSPDVSVLYEIVKKRRNHDEKSKCFL